MILPSSAISGRQSGTTLLELLVALAILAVLLTAAAAMFRGPSAQILAERRAAAIVRDSAALRDRAVAEGAVKLMSGPGCAGEAEVTLHFFPDGTASGPDLCIVEGSRSLRLTVNRLTGHVALRSVP